MTLYMRLTNWTQFQHYKDRSPPWIKLHREILTSEAWVLGTDSSRLLQVASMLLAARYDNRIPCRYELIRKVGNVGVTEAQFVDAILHLSDHNFLEIHTVTESGEILVQDASSVLATCTSEERQRRDRGETESPCAPLTPAPQHAPASPPQPTDFPTDTHGTAEDGANSESKEPPCHDLVPAGHTQRVEKKYAHIASGVDDAWWENFRSGYPKRTGDQRWPKARQAANARLKEGYTPEQLMDGRDRYRAYLEATEKIGTEYVQQAATFLGTGRAFLLPWVIPPPKEGDYEKMMRLNGTPVRTQETTNGRIIDHDAAERDANYLAFINRALRR